MPVIRRAAVFLILLPAWGLSQTTGTLRGTVRDPSGAIIVQAHVTAVQVGTNLSRLAVSNTYGDYDFAALPVGTYDLEVQVSGFKRYVRKGIEVSLGHVVVVDAALQLGALSQVITTEAAAPLVETSSTQLGAVMNGRAVTSLPLNARDTYQLLQLQPGVESQV
ncbi:MAG TPA: carboxypeptidase-like regulatory domain-containing protein, partial [Candidatus Methylomirabilis sp.]|nr:carboxypeptidase-like regulatory domain-containing protein [Candidatus Methylomirabilis sp.]